MIDIIQNKKAVLIAQRGQLEQAIQQANANLNATIGAIMACDELIAETLAEQSRVAVAAVVEAANIPEAVVTVVDPTPAPVEMLAVSHFVPCDDCIVDCESDGRCCCA